MTLITDNLTKGNRKNIENALIGGQLNAMVSPHLLPASLRRSLAAHERGFEEVLVFCCSNQHSSRLLNLSPNAPPASRNRSLMWSSMAK